MKDIFEAMDQWQSRLNIFRADNYLANVALIFAISMLIPWMILGFDSGVGMVEIWQSNWNLNYDAYGKSLHFSAFTIYGILYYGISKHLNHLGIRESKNTFYSASLSVFNIGLFEFWYMGSFAAFQMQRHPLEWLISDFWEIPVVMNFLFIVVGAIALLCVHTDSFKLNSGKVVGRYFSFQPDLMTITLLTLPTLASIFTWIWYPFPVETISIHDWTSSTLFPQTHYAYVNSALYVANDLLHLVNVITKALFAFIHYYIITQFKVLPWA